MGYYDIIVDRRNREPNVKWKATYVDAYKEYQKIDKRLIPEEMDWKLYKTIMKDFFYEISLMVIKERFILKMPYSLGEVSIRKRKNNGNLNKNRLDFKHFNATGKKRYLINLHSNRFYFFFDWKKPFGHRIFKNSSVYRFVPNRGNDYVIGKRGLSKWIKQCAENPKIKDFDALLKL